jgi:hypothetical protein
MNETMTETQQQVEVIIPEVSEPEAIRLQRFDDKVEIITDRLGFIVAMEKSCKSENYYFVGGFFRTVPKLNVNPTGTLPADRKNAVKCRFIGKVVKYQRSSGRVNFDYDELLKKAQERAGVEVTGAGNRRWGSHLTPNAIGHNLEGTDIYRAYIPYNPQRFFDTYYVWASTGEVLTDDEVVELKKYQPERKEQLVPYNDFAVDGVVWLNSNGKHYVLTPHLTDMEFLQADIDRKEAQKAAKKVKTPPSL